MSQGTNFPDLHGSSTQSTMPVPWHRVKWTEKMIRLLITAVSYTGDEIVGKGKCGKWKLVSKAMSDRGFHVSPQQCEDKFYDLNKRYKRLNEMLGRGTSCDVVENPALLNVIDFLSEKEKDEVRKILSSKHLFYEEMCSYNNGNRLHLPHDPELQRFMKNHNFNDDDDRDGNECRVIRLEERKSQYQLEVLELKRQRVQWEMICRRRDQELEEMRMENEKMKLENERIAFELKRKEMERNSKLM